MNSLQTSLAIAGGVILIVLVAWNAWNARRNEPRRPRPEEPHQERREPSASGITGSDDGADTGRIEPSFDNSDALPLPTPERHLRLDALIDVIAPIALDGRVLPGDALLAALPATRRAGSKPFAIEGLNGASGEWEAPVPGQRYHALQAGVQLANRSGALNEIEFSEFIMKAQQYADTVGGAPDFPDMLQEVARARELDQFAGQHDAQLGFTLRARGASWSPGFIHQQAARLGFVPGVIPGRMVMPAAESGLPPILDLSFDARAALAEDPAQAAIRLVTLNLDVPQVPRGEQPFARLREATFALAEAMDGQITDDAGQSLRPETIDTIGADLDRLYDTLEQHDLAAGSPQARRLFS